MARLPRLTVPNELHLIFQSSRLGQVAIEDQTDAEAYVRLLPEAAKATGVVLHAYGLHRHEVRLLVTPQTSAALGLFMQWIGRRYVRAFNDRHHRSGSPWEGRFRSTVLEAGRWGLACLRFVEGRASSDEGVGNEPMASSRQHHFHHAPDAAITQHSVFWRLGNTPFEREAAYRRLCAEPLTLEESERIMHSARFGWALGSNDFTAAMTEQAGRPAMRRPAGRPLKKGRQPSNNKKQ